MHERRFNPAHANRLEDPERLRWLPPNEIVEALRIQPGTVVADVGAGTGYFALPLARAVGPAGKIVAVDAQQEMLALLEKKLNAPELAHVELVQAEAHETSLQAGSCALVFLANIWHEFDDRKAVLHEAMRILQPGGRVAILDWRTDVEPEAGPPLDHRIAAAHTERELREAGFAPHGSARLWRYSWLVQGEKQP